MQPEKNYHGESLYFYGAHYIRDKGGRGED
jgi:hypothetical protein